MAADYPCGVAPDDKTRELQEQERRREELAAEAAEHAPEEEEARTEERRAERAAYLRDKLAERARSEDERDD
jgi:hypothetical protein